MRIPASFAAVVGFAAVSLVAACAPEHTTSPRLISRSAWADAADGGNAAVDGGVYTATNNSAGNAVVAFARHSDGSLTPLGTFPTGGMGSGGAVDPLGSQGSIELDHGHQLLFVVNAGSNEISSFRVRTDGLELADKVSSGGTEPVSIAVHGSRLFVLDQSSDAIAGFRVAGDGRLEPVPEWTRHLSAVGAHAATVRYTPDGRFLVVSLRLAQHFDVFPIGPDGTPAATPVTSPTSGPNPFGFGFTRNGFAIVSEEFGRAPLGAVSSYDVQGDGTLAVITPSSPTSGPGACWVAITRDNRFTFISNTGGGTLSSYAIASDGSLTPVALVAADPGPGSSPLDSHLSRDDRFFYVLLGGRGTIASYGVDGGTLSPLAETPATPPASGEQGLAAW